MTTLRRYSETQQGTEALLCLVAALYFVGFLLAVEAAIDRLNGF